MGGLQVEVQARITNDEAQDQETASYAYELLERLASLAGKNPAPSENFARETVSPSAAKTTPTKSRSTSAKEGSPVHAVITKIDRMKTRQGDSLFLKVDVGGETVRVFGRPEELAERLEASGYDIPASEIEAGMELHLPCLVKVGQGHNGYKNIEKFLPVNRPIFPHFDSFWILIDFCINNGIIGTGGIRLCPDRVEALIYWKIGASG